MLSPSNSSSADSDDSDYIPTPLRPKLRISVPHHCIFLDLKQIEKFVDHLNDMRGCKTAGCKVPLEVVTRGMGGTATVAYMCDGCRGILELKASSENTTLANNDINLAAQVAFITTYTTYCKALQLLGIKPVSSNYFMIHPELHDGSIALLQACLPERLR